MARTEPLSPSGIRTAALTHPGLVRQHNEDAFALMPGCDLYIICDGVGGRAGGQTAAQIVTEALPELLRGPLTARDLTGPALRQLLAATLAQLSRTMRKEARRWAGQAGMGTTVVLAVVRGDKATIAHLGDSRAYRFHHGALTRLTTDHSVTGILVQRGEITEQHARRHPARGRITRYVGMPGDAGPDLATSGFRPGDRLLLCTDGLTAVVPDHEITAKLAGTSGNPAAACQQLIGAALAAGAPDNVTVLVADRVQANGPAPVSRPTRAVRGNAPWGRR
jgi:protein phosphatase